MILNHRWFVPYGSELVYTKTCRDQSFSQIQGVKTSWGFVTIIQRIVTEGETQISHVSICVENSPHTKGHLNRIIKRLPNSCQVSEISENTLRLIVQI